ncbi:DUF3710 domain-containing protein [Bifidobacterium sp. 82T24]|uniref:DUF3710 domain-containing protein n=1 Tax=Bifidobacterium pluvialisilvae TaxID=2834436 RepID=UPI001C5773AD|nr:DUF3710 domain-containing protein [Bifidobacterium pluvialisilvae]MBW3087338.1 DUF3710 domain-containing protein [Bifidobacterium pluvialisilvae]
MGLFGFGKKHHDAEEATKDVDVDETADAVEDVEGTEDADAAAKDANPGEGERGVDHGPWDVDDENIPDYDDYLDIGSLYLPFLQGIELRLKGARKTGTVLGATITLGDSSLEMEAFAAPKSYGLWDDVRADLLEANEGAEEVEGVFGTELRLPVKVKDKTLNTRIVGVDGPRWMLRGIFTGPSAEFDGDSDEKTTLDKYFSDMVVDRGEEPLAPRDLIPMHAPVGPAERAKQAEAEAKAEDDKKKGVPGKPDGPLTKTVQTETQTTLRRGPLFSEVR